jgi:hypothetical protein
MARDRHSVRVTRVQPYLSGVQVSKDAFVVVLIILFVFVVLVLLGHVV